MGAQWLNVATVLQQARDDLAAQAAGPATSYGVQLVRTVLVLVLVCAAAYAALRYAARRGIAQRWKGTHMRVIEHIALDASHQLFLVEVGTRVLLLGGSAGSLQLISEISRDEIPREVLDAARPAASSFRDMLARMRGLSTPSRPPTGAARNTTTDTGARAESAAEPEADTVTRS